MDIPQTVRDALAPVEVADATCLEAGAGAGNMAVGLRAAGADRVVAITDDWGHATDVRDRVPGDVISVVTAALQRTPMPDDTVDVVTAHALCNVLTPPVLVEVVAELTRVANPGSHLVVVDYTPLPDGAVAELFAIENAISLLNSGHPAYTFYPEQLLRTVFEVRGWDLRDRQLLLDPVPWSVDLLADHAALAREATKGLRDPLATELRTTVESVMADIDDGIDAGQYYALVFTLSPGTAD